MLGFPISATALKEQQRRPPPVDRAFAPVGRVVDDSISNSGCRSVGPRVPFRWFQGAVSLHSTLLWAVGSLPLRGASLTLTTFPPFLLTMGYMRLCPCGLDPQSHTISHATRCVPTLIAGSCWVGHGGAHAFFRYIPLSVETLRATSLRGGGIVGWVGFRQFIPIGAMYIL